MFTEKGAGSESESKRPSYMLDRSLIDERARTALDKIPHSKAPVYDQADEEGFAERAEERLKEATVWLQSEKSKVSLRDYNRTTYCDEHINATRGRRRVEEA